MPLTDIEVSRLADAAAALRPAWHSRSLRTFIAQHLRDRAFGDVAVALAVVATDERQETPRALLEAGPWWRAAVDARRGSTPHVGPRPGTDRCNQPGHEHEEARRCRACCAEQAAGTTPDEHPAPSVPAPDLRALIHATRETV